VEISVGQPLRERLEMILEFLKVKTVQQRQVDGGFVVLPVLSVHISGATDIHVVIEVGLP